jgi:hypothetical protein
MRRILSKGLNVFPLVSKLRMSTAKIIQPLICLSLVINEMHS